MIMDTHIKTWGKVGFKGNYFKEEENFWIKCANKHMKTRIFSYMHTYIVLSFQRIFQQVIFNFRVPSPP